MPRYNILLIFFNAFLAINSYAQINDSSMARINADIQKLRMDKTLNNSSFGIYAEDISSDSALIDINSGISLVPASTLKIITTAAILEILGKDFRFKTLIQYDGNIDSSGVLNGNVYINGGGDPTLGSKLFSKNNLICISQWANSITGLGIKSIKGSVISDASIFGQNELSDTWTWGDIGNYYGTCVSGLSFADNQYEITLKSGKKNGDSTIILKVEPKLNNIKFYNKIVSSTDNEDNSNIFGSPYDDKRFLTGTIPVNKNRFVILGALPEPAIIAARLLNDTLLKRGISIDKTPSAIYLHDKKKFISDRKDIFTTWSPTLEKIIKMTNTNSINVYAEILLKHIGLNYKSNVKGTDIDKLLDFWTKNGIDPHGIFLDDGCGLSRYSGVTAKYLVNILIYMKKRSKNFTSFYNSLPVAGKTGSMKNIGKNTSADDNIHAKTGYITRVRSYSGYARTKKGKDIAFAIIVNNFSCSPGEMKKKVEQIMIDLTELSY